MFTKDLLQNKFIYDLLVQIYYISMGLRKIAQLKWGCESKKFTNL